MTNSADPDHLVQKPTDLDLHVCKGRACPGLAGQGLIYIGQGYFFLEKRLLILSNIRTDTEQTE